MIQLKIKSKGIDYICLLDEEDLEKIKDKKLFIKHDKNSNNKYVRFSLKKKKISLHRYIMNVTNINIHIDHINGNGLDNRKSNLRLCTRSENMRNTKSRKNSNSKYLGVYWNNTHKKWIAEVRCNNKRVHCSYHNDEKEAAKKRDNIAKQYHGEFVRLNFYE